MSCGAHLHLPRPTEDIQNATSKLIEGQETVQNTAVNVFLIRFNLHNPMITACDHGQLQKANVQQDPSTGYETERTH